MADDGRPFATQTAATFALSGTVLYEEAKQGRVTIRYGTLGPSTLLEATPVARALRYAVPRQQVTTALARAPQDERLREHCFKLRLPGMKRQERRFFDEHGVVVFLRYCCRTRPKPAERFSAFLRGLSAPVVAVPDALVPLPTKETEVVDHVRSACRRFSSETQVTLRRVARRLDLYFPVENVVVECDERETHDRKHADDALRERQVREELPGCAVLRFVPETGDLYEFVGNLLEELYSRRRGVKCDGNETEALSRVPELKFVEAATPPSGSDRPEFNARAPAPAVACPTIS